MVQDSVFFNLITKRPAKIFKDTMYQIKECDIIKKYKNKAGDSL